MENTQNAMTILFIVYGLLHILISGRINKFYKNTFYPNKPEEFFGRFIFSETWLRVSGAVLLIWAVFVNISLMV